MADQTMVALGISPQGTPVPIQLTAAGLLSVSGGSGSSAGASFTGGYVLIGLTPDGNRRPIAVDNNGVVQTYNNVTLTIPADAQIANTIFAGPTSGGVAAPTFRSLVIGDLPTLAIGDLPNTIMLINGSRAMTGNLLLSSVNPSILLNSTVTGVPSISFEDGGVYKAGLYWDRAADRLTLDDTVVAFTGGLTATLATIGHDEVTTDKALFILNDDASFRGEFGYNESGNTILHIANTYNDNAARFDFRMKGSAAANTVMSLLGSGRLGIGTVSPQAALHILGTSQEALILAGGNAPRLYWETDGSHVNWRMSAQDAVSEGITIASGTANANPTASTYTNLFTILTTGNVGIGIGLTNPSQLLTLKSTGQLAWDNGSGTADVNFSRVSSTVLGINGIPKFTGTNSSGAGTALLGAANSPATVLSAPYTWISAVAADGTAVFIPAWK